MTIRLTPGDLAAAALYITTNDGWLSQFIYDRYADNSDVLQPPTWEECLEWVTDYGDMTEQLAAAIPRLVETEADRRVSKMLSAKETGG